MGVDPHYIMNVCAAIRPHSIIVRYSIYLTPKTTTSLEEDIQPWTQKEAATSRHHAHSDKRQAGNTENPVVCIENKHPSGSGHKNTIPSQQALNPREPSIALTVGQGIPDQLNNNHELYDGITSMIHVAMEDSFRMDPENSMLASQGRCEASPPRNICGWIRPCRM